MKLKFIDQQFQTDAVNAIADIFEGSEIKESVFTIDMSNNNQKNGNNVQGDGLTYELGYANKLTLDDFDLLKNVRAIQERNNILKSTDLQGRNFSIEMETGTGKTYVYTRTIFELNIKYGWSKFIIVVPSIAIREGVKKSLEQTQDHFMEIYGKKVRFFIYNSSNLGMVDQFSKDKSINVMIINIQAFNTRSAASRKIYEIQDDFSSRRPIDVIKRNRPILILDEPQKMGGEVTQESLKNFNPLFSINYSATHRIQHNLVHVLDALDAYNQKLVKKIQVKGFQIKNLRGTNGYLYLQKIAIYPNKPPRALIEIEIDYNKSINRETRWFDVGDNLYNTSKHMNQYKDGFVISEINPTHNSVSFINGETLFVGNSSGDIVEIDIRRIQIRETILSHFEKEEELFEKGIKVLSLFFIDEVSKYREYDEEGNGILGIYGQIFEEEYKKVLEDERTIFNRPYEKYLNNIDPEKTHKGYFSIDKKGRSIDSPTKRNSDESDDISAYDLILKDKERLLSFEEPTRFIFSHSALREGWDNPNVFQICTLKHSSNDVQRHQEVGRGLRICVDKSGERMDSSVTSLNFHQINKLTVIANESYEDFVRGLQNQIQENLFERPTSISETYFVNKTVSINESDEKATITQSQAKQLYFYLVKNQYVDENGKITDQYKNDLSNNTLITLPTDIETMSDGIHKLIQRVYDNSIGIDIENGNATKVEINALNDNFYKQEFKELWNRINHKYAYTVYFDSKELIKNAITAINYELNVTRLIYTVAVGEQRVEIDQEKVRQRDSFKSAKTKSDTIQSSANESVTYDLIGKIREKTQLTRKTIAEILKSISQEKFSMFKINPEEFIKKVSNIINEQKSTMIVQHVKYNKTDEVPFDSDIFTQEKSKADFLKAFKSKKNVQDYVFEDSKGEKKFAEELDNADEVVVYAKLPRGFYIPTPVGNYSPDWAISFKKEAVKHIYFIAETKGSLDNMQLKRIEIAKIECASKLFETISDSNVKYGKVVKYQDLLSLIRD